jgi:DNA polymerase III subunit gamma/tau
MQDGSPGDGWLTLTEAATLLGLSVDTVRRRVKRGELEARMVPTPHGAAWRVRPPSAPTLGATVVPTVDATPGAAPMQVAGAPAMGELVGLVGRLHDENRALAEAAATWQTRAEVLALQLEDARAQLALSAPANAPESHTAPNLTPQGQEPPREPPAPEPEPAPPPTPAPIPPGPDGRSWWRRWLAAVVG